MIIDKRPAGQVLLPPSKSISHRVLISAALSGGGMISNLSDNHDTEATLRCLQALGACTVRENDTLIFTSGLGCFDPREILDCGESGSTLRFMIPVAAGLGLRTSFTGKGRLLDRPLGPYEKSLAQHDVTMAHENGQISLIGQLTAGTFELQGDISSQFVTGFLFALPLLTGDSEIKILGPLQSRAYVDLTIEVLERFRIRVINEGYERFLVPGNQRYISCDSYVEADYSGAAFFLAAAALGCDVECVGLDAQSKQGDRQFLQILMDSGCQIIPGPNGGICVKPGDLHAITVDVSEIPDLVPPLAALMAFLPGESRIVNAARLRIKESDRLQAVAEELNRLGCAVTEGEDSLVIRGMERIRGGEAFAHNDHRIAMMAAVASVRAEQPVIIDTPDVVSKSYPNFWRDFCHESFR